MIRAFSEMLSYAFLTRALIVGTLVSLCASILGVSLVLKRYSMIGDGLSHVGFGALAAASAFGLAPLAVAIPVVSVSAFLLLRISDEKQVKGDSAVALISTTALALGVLVVSLSGVNTDLNSFLFGSILGISGSDTLLCVVISLCVLVLYLLFYNEIFAITFDETFAKASGTNAGLYNMLLALMTALTIVLGMRMMGTLLITSLIIFPPLTSMRLCKTFRSVVISSAAVSVFCFLFGLTASYMLSAPTGASIVTVNAALFVLFTLIERVRG